MMTNMCNEINKFFPLTEIDCGEFSVQKISGMKFNIHSYYAEGLGTVSAMTAAGFFGLMKMDTLIINPFEKDMPMLSYDRVFAMGNDTLIFDLCDSFLEGTDMTDLEKVKSTFLFPEYDLGTHWYDSLRIPASLAKKGKKKNKAEFDQFVFTYLNTFLQIAKQSASCEKEPKIKKAAVYVEGLLQNGGPSTDIFIKNIGREKTEKLFRQYLFGTGNVS